MDKPIKIIFSKKASSKNLPEALRLANKLGGISEGDIIRIKLSTQEVFNLWEWINALLNIIDKWASFEIRIILLTSRNVILHGAVIRSRRCP